MENEQNADKFVLCTFVQICEYKSIDNKKIKIKIDEKV